jgi:WD40 repeat protein
VDGAVAGADARARGVDDAPGDFHSSRMETGRAHHRRRTTSPDGSLLASGGDDKEVKLWDVTAATAMKFIK